MYREFFAISSKFLVFVSQVNLYTFSKCAQRHRLKMWVCAKFGDRRWISKTVLVLVVECIHPHSVFISYTCIWCFPRNNDGSTYRFAGFLVLKQFRGKQKRTHGRCSLVKAKRLDHKQFALKFFANVPGNSEDRFLGTFLGGRAFG